MLENVGHIDGPSNTLLEVIKENNGKAPGDWKGFRILTDKWKKKKKKNYDFFFFFFY